MVVYDGRTITYSDDHCTLSTTEDRVTAKYIPPDDTRGTPFEEYWEDPRWNRGEATTQARRHVLPARVDEKELEEDEASTSEHGAVLGVDLNRDGYPAVTSTGAFLGNADYLKYKRNGYERRRRKLQQTATRSAQLRLKSTGDGFSNWSEDYLRRVALALVLEPRRHDCDAIAFEKLKHIRECISNASKFQQWAFNKPQFLVEYEAEEYGIPVDDVKPQYTPQRCSHSECGFTHDHNRDDDEFECLNRGKELHADYNAARNVGWRLVQHRVTSGAGRADCQVALSSGMVNANG